MQKKLRIIDSPIEEPIKEGTVWVKGEAFYIYRGEGWELVGPQGKRGEPFRYEDFTEEQLKALVGPKGEKGDQGERGEIGPQGIPGIQGIQGPIGLTGPQGPQGERGPIGFKGVQGDTGPIGLQGEKGEKGDPFTYDDFTPTQLALLKGDKGDPGDKGAKGEKGEKGETGATGRAFVYSDFTDAQLAKLKGPKGDKGDPFTYNDFTQAQLDSLKGERGKKGDVGPQGPEGPRGPIGYNIESISQTQVSKDSGGTNIITFKLSNGDIQSIYLYNGGEGGEGTKGEKGEQGAKGDNGLSIDSIRKTEVTGGTQVEFLLSDGTSIGSIIVKDGDATDAINQCNAATTKANAATTESINATGESKIATKKALDAANFVDKSAHKVTSTIDSQNVLTTTLYDKQGLAISSAVVNIPLESMVTGGSYANGEITLTLSDGSTIKFPVADLVDGLVSEERLKQATDELKINDSDLLTRIALEEGKRRDDDIDTITHELSQTEDEYKLKTTITTVGAEHSFESSVDLPLVTKTKDGIMAKKDKEDHDRVVKWVDGFPLERAGDSNSVQTKDNGNTVIAQNCFAIGKDNTCDDHYTYAFGLHNYVKGSWGFLIGQGNSSERMAGYAFAIGSGNSFKGSAYASGIIGFYNKINNRYSFASGFDNIINGEYNTAMGLSLRTNNPNEVAFGKYNVSIKADDTDPTVIPTIFTIGHGEEDTARENWLEIRENKNLYTWLPNTLTNELEYQSLQELFTKKQNKLIADERITIDQTTNKIKADPYFIVVEELPDTGKKNQIYLLKGKDEDDKPTYTQYGYIDTVWRAISSDGIKYKAGEGIKINKDEIKADVIDDKVALTSTKKTWSVSKLIDYFGSPMKFQGQVNEIDDLELIALKNPGDVYNVKEDHNNYCYVSAEKGWVIIGSSEIDLSDYFNKTQTAQVAEDTANTIVTGYNTDIAQPALNKKQDKEDHDLVTTAKTVVGAITELYNRGQVYYGYTDPASTLGKDGDLYMKVIK